MAVPGRRRRAAAAARRTQIAINGHAIEARLYAEDPDARFPAVRPGRISPSPLPAPSEQCASIPASRRATRSPSYYDPMIAKLIVWADDRERRLRAACDGARRDADRPASPPISLSCRRSPRHPAFATGEVDTGFIERHRERLLAPRPPAGDESCRGGAVHPAERKPARGSASPWAAADGWRLNRGSRDRDFRFERADRTSTSIRSATTLGAGYSFDLGNPAAQ